MSFKPFSNSYINNTDIFQYKSKVWQVPQLGWTLDKHMYDWNWASGSSPNMQDYPPIEVFKAANLWRVNKIDMPIYEFLDKLLGT